MAIYLIRHGESEGNRTAKVQGCEDFELSTKGKRQVLRLGEHFADLPIDHFYSSDLTRARETAAAIEKYQHLKAIPSKDFREIYLGPLEGKTRDQIYELYPHVRHKTILRSGLEGTETDEEITIRCEKLYHLVRSIKEDETAAIVSHGGFLSIFLMYLLAGENWNALHRPFRIDNTGVSKISWKDDKLLIHYINQYHHLKK
ncbi:histidine phosphatase family protein [Salibacterium aidingense]|uniref:histidine phosphatase family protein n=1 Tax=Salibacterium aidingense TaxID=384933 RepID=UPI0004134570|nr:histidine phosphatase family protein [Salibacterium aidingense]